ncbi:MAG: PaaI family thioesterase [Smithellaceae bacterium]|jgi:acyl-CoA thioesterase|nr:PaaI family thioesterase [Smithellaceae bacterium]MDD3259321.1 PaaI family thioesterase [Smithellaceae bacterium]MDD3848936.1 PaaI family thioesterase [Smithellaceae bacterium]HOG13215.1 PaaI family thioesterase [Smithellaceae bacterium]HOZ62612.1 PaaI family thioesterase [Smithellaceae bacterium]
MDEKVRKAIFKRMEQEPFGRKFGITLVDIKEGYARVEMRFTSDMENMFGIAHGGAIFSLMDAAFEVASNSHGTMAVALNMSVNYLASPAKGALINAEASEINKTKRTAAYDIRATDESGKLLAACQALVYRLDKPLPFLEDKDRLSP